MNIFTENIQNIQTKPKTCANLSSVVVGSTTSVSESFIGTVPATVRYCQYSLSKSVTQFCQRFCSV